MSIADDTAFVLHEQWRQNRLREDDTYEPRWKKINDEKFIADLEGNELPNYVRKTEAGYEIDIANAYYTQLSADWQNENKAAAEVVTNIIQSGKELSRDEIGEIIHNAWLERNSWAKDGELGVPFTELPEEEKNKDMLQYDIALTLSQAKFENKHFSRLEDVANFLFEARLSGENIAYKFNGKNLYSKYDNPDVCFIKVCGYTVKEHQIVKAKLLQEYENKTKEAINNIPDWKKRGEGLIYPQRKDNWHKCVESRAKNLYHGLDLVNAIEVMEALEQGKTIEEATKIVNKEKHSACSREMVMNIVTLFSKKGPEFYRANNKNITPKMEKVLQGLENENHRYEALSKETGPDLTL